MFINKLKALGPGLLYAGAAIGVSHIVQSTRAGAEYGYILIIAVILAHFFKYPFFSVGPRYTQVTGLSLISGYKSLGSKALILVFLITLSTMFFVQAAVTVVTAGLAQKLTGLLWAPWLWSAFLLLICFLVLQLGNFNVLDRFIKVIMLVLAISTLMAFLFSFSVVTPAEPEFQRRFSIFNMDDMHFLVAFIGWMPAPLDIAIWHSMWTAARCTEKGNRKMKAENFDFKVGFYGTAVLAICFLVLGANTLYGNGISLEVQAGKYAAQLVDIYTASLGNWSYYIILIAAFTTMFSTTLTCFDAMPRVITAIVSEWQLEKKSILAKRWFWMLVLGLGSVLILCFFVASMKQMVHLATVISFLTAPLLAILAYRLVSVTKKGDKIWSKAEKSLAFAGILFLSVFSIYFLITMVWN